MILTDIIKYLEKLAPEKLQASWDNSGLLAGLKSDKIDKILISLDFTSTVLDYAKSIKADLIVTHHPYFISPVKKINDPLLIELIRSRISLYSMHTNLDFIKGGVNSSLAEVIGLQEATFLHHLLELNTFQVTVFTPAEHIDQVKKAVSAAGGAVIGNYSYCFNTSAVKGSFKPLAGSSPFISGEKGEVVSVDEERLEFTVETPYLEKVLSSMIAAHPYETPAYRVFPLKQENPNYGIGIVGTLPAEISVKELALSVKEKLKAPSVKLWLAHKEPTEKVKTVAVCGGSGSDLIPIAAKKADIFVTSDIKYHSIIDSKIPLIDAGHFYTENVVLPVIARHLEPLGIDIEQFSLESADIRGLMSL